MSRFLVTGATGFIGSYLVEALTKLDHDVIAVDIGLQPESASRAKRLTKNAHITLAEVDLTDQVAVSRLPAVDGVYHLAALNGTQNFYTRPFSTLRNSSTPTVNLLERYRAEDLRFFFYAGSSESYAATIQTFSWPLPTSEEVVLTAGHPTETRYSYAVAKTLGEFACFAAQVESGIPVVIGRLHNPYGPNMGLNHVIPDFVSRGVEGRFELHGARQTRSFIYIEDAVNAIIALSQVAIGKIVNIGTQDEIEMIALARKIMNLAGWKGQIEEYPSPPNSVDRRVPDTGLLRSLMDTSGFRSLDEGLYHTVNSMLGVQQDADAGLAGTK